MASGSTVGNSLESDDNLEHISTNRVVQDESFSAYVALARLKRLGPLSIVGDFFGM